MTTKNKILIAITLLAIGFGSGYFAKPSSVQTVTVEKIVTQIQKEESKNRIIYKEKIVYKDGTVREIESSQDSSTSKENSTTDSSKSSSKIVKNDIGLTLQALAIINLDNLAGSREYGIYAKKRVISNISVGVLATTDKKIGVGIGLDF